MKTILGNEIRVRRRYSWVSLLRFPLSEDQAELLVTLGDGSIDQVQGNRRHVLSTDLRGRL